MKKGRLELAMGGAELLSAQGAREEASAVRELIEEVEGLLRETKALKKIRRQRTKGESSRGG